MNFEFLDKQTKQAAGEMGGVLSVGYLNLSTGESYYYNESHIFPAASIVKVPILLEYFHRIDEGRLSADEIMELRTKDKVGGAGVLTELHPGLPLTILDLAILMIVISDNTASNMLLDKLGMDEINAFMKSLGLKDTVIGRKFMIDPNAKFSKNFTSVADMVHLLKLLYEGKVLTEKSTAEAMEILGRQQYNEKIPLHLPDKLKIAHKTGEITGVRHDCGIILHETTPYVFCILTEELPDVVQADRIIAKLSLDFYNESTGV
ncbi:MAG: class A beta-lactamase-related serine hydrolase [Firmicutes bacterium]|nr:class A beta-lactamase-related serine hydrolase [Bacillota bacterium]